MDLADFIKTKGLIRHILAVRADAAKNADKDEIAAVLISIMDEVRSLQTADVEEYVAYLLSTTISD